MALSLVERCELNIGYQVEHRRTYFRALLEGGVPTCRSTWPLIESKEHGIGQLSRKSVRTTVFLLAANLDHQKSRNSHQCKKWHPYLHTTRKFCCFDWTCFLSTWRQQMLCRWLWNLFFISSVWPKAHNESKLLVNVSPKVDGLLKWSISTNHAKIHSKTCTWNQQK